MKKFLICLSVFMLTAVAFSQPPQPPSQHGGWHGQIASPDIPVEQKYYFDINTQNFKPYSNSTPLGTGTAVLIGLLGGYVGVTVWRGREKRK